MPHTSCVVEDIIRNLVVLFFVLLGKVLYSVQYLVFVRRGGVVDRLLTEMLIAVQAADDVHRS